MTLTFPVNSISEFHLIFFVTLTWRSQPLYLRRQSTSVNYRTILPAQHTFSKLNGPTARSYFLYKLAKKTTKNICIKLYKLIYKFNLFFYISLLLEVINSIPLVTSTACLPLRVLAQPTSTVQVY